jgi:hypothetical protein
MNKPCGNKHPLYNAGSPQTARAPEVLRPKNVVYDERTASDWLIYLCNYAKHINYFATDDGETASATWEKFFDNDISMLLARLAEEQLERLNAEISGLLSSLQKDDLTNAQAKKKFTLLLSHIFNIAYRLNTYYVNLDAGASIREAIENRVITHMELRLKRLISYYKAAALPQHDVLDAAILTTPPLGYQPIENLADWGLEKAWHITSASVNWQAYVGGIAADESPFKRNVLNPVGAVEKINLAAKYQLLTESIKGFLQGFAAIIQIGRKEFDKTMGNWPDHWPDKALLLSFLNVLDLYRDEINTFTTRHLDHYYKEVLQLAPKSAVADSVFLVAELAKNQTKALVAKGTQFSAGKDDNGKERIYAANTQSVLNRAEVVSQKAIYNTGFKVHAAQNVATANGLEEKLEFPENGYSAFGNAALPEAEVGFALASDHLFMKDGNRTINLILAGTPAQKLTQNMVTGFVARATLRVTGEKGWIAIATKLGSYNNAANTITITGTVPVEEGAVVAANANVHERSFYPNLPVAEVIINTYDHHILQEFKLQSAQVNISVSGCTHPEVVTQQGSVDTSKPFQAFGPIPTKNAAVVIGVQEMLRKQVTSLTVNVAWADRNTASEQASSTWNGSPLKVQQISGNSWATKLNNQTAKATYTVTNLTPQGTATDAAFAIGSTQGFIRLQLGSTLEHKNYPAELTTKMAEIANKEIDNVTSSTIPKPYYIPTIERITVDYSATSVALNLARSANYKTAGTAFYHITPYGGYEASGNMVLADNPPVVPALPNEGEFFVGLANAVGGEQISILIDVLEGSANPLKAKLEVKWQYLQNNAWKDFGSGALTDGTDGLIKTGLLKVTLPFGFADASTFFEPGNVWIRATIAQHSDAVCRVVGVFAQGLQATLISTDHPNDHYQIPLAAQTISKPKVTNTAIKKFAQPVAAVGGKAAESDDHFYTRVSERLRHKARAVAFWDYERLVLEEFPELSLAKALSHTKYYVDPVTNQLDYSESAPGHVSVVCVPQKQNDFNLTNKPFTPVNSLQDISTYLSSQLPEWATLHVRNPLFEEVQIDCRVRFMPEVTDINFHLELLNQELQQYLSPWKAQNNSTLAFNWRVHKSHIIDFIDERPYVDFVRDVKMNLIFGTGDLDRAYDVNEAVPRYAISVLTSANSHVIDPIT